MRVKRENSELKTLNFTSYKKLYFHCLVSVELKPHKKVLKKLFRNITLKNLYVTPKLPTYFSTVIRYVRTKWGVALNILWNIFCALVWPSTLEHHCLQVKCSCFLPIWIRTIQWLCSLFAISTAVLFLGKFGPKNQNWQFILKFGTWINSKRIIQWRCSIFLLFIGITLFGQIWSN